MTDSSLPTPSRYAGDTQLHALVSYGYVNDDALLYALRAGAVPANARNQAGQTALHLAVQCAYFRGLELLLAHGAHVGQADARGRTPMHIAAMLPRFAPETVSRLWDSGSEVTYTDNEGFTPLHLAAATDNGPCVAALLYYGASLDAINAQGDAPIHLACSSGGSDAAKALIGAGCSVITRGSQGLLPQELAEASGNRSLAALLSKSARLQGASSGHRGPYAGPAGVGHTTLAGSPSASSSSATFLHAMASPIKAPPASLPAASLGSGVRTRGGRSVRLEGDGGPAYDPSRGAGGEGGYARGPIAGYGYGYEYEGQEEEEGVYDQGETPHSALSLPTPLGVWPATPAGRTSSVATASAAPPPPPPPGVSPFAKLLQTGGGSAQRGSPLAARSSASGGHAGFMDATSSPAPSSQQESLHQQQLQYAPPQPQGLAATPRSSKGYPQGSPPRTPASAGSMHTAERPPSAGFGSSSSSHAGLGGAPLHGAGGGGGGAVSVGSGGKRSIRGTDLYTPSWSPQSPPAGHLQSLGYAPGGVAPPPLPPPPTDVPPVQGLLTTLAQAQAQAQGKQGSGGKLARGRAQSVRSLSHLSGRSSVTTSVRSAGSESGHGYGYGAGGGGAGGAEEAWQDASDGGAGLGEDSMYSGAGGGVDGPPIPPRVALIFGPNQSLNSKEAATAAALASVMSDLPRPGSTTTGAGHPYQQQYHTQQQMYAPAELALAQPSSTASPPSACDYQQQASAVSGVGRVGQYQEAATEQAPMYHAQHSGGGEDQGRVQSEREREGEDGMSTISERVQRGYALLEEIARSQLGQGQGQVQHAAAAAAQEAQPVTAAASAAAPHPDSTHFVVPSLAHEQEGGSTHAAEALPPKLPAGHAAKPARPTPRTPQEVHWNAGSLFGPAAVAAHASPHALYLSAGLPGPSAFLPAAHSPGSAYGPGPDTSSGRGTHEVAGEVMSSHSLRATVFERDATLSVLQQQMKALRADNERLQAQVQVLQSAVHSADGGSHSASGGHVGGGKGGGPNDLTKGGAEQEQEELLHAEITRLTQLTAAQSTELHSLREQVQHAKEDLERAYAAYEQVRAGTAGMRAAVDAAREETRIKGSEVQASKAELTQTVKRHENAVAELKRAHATEFSRQEARHDEAVRALNMRIEELTRQLQEQAEAHAAAVSAAQAQPVPPGDVYSQQLPAASLTPDTGLGVVKPASAAHTGGSTPEEDMREDDNVPSSVDEDQQHAKQERIMSVWSAFFENAVRSSAGLPLRQSEPISMPPTQAASQSAALIEANSIAAATALVQAVVAGDGEAVQSLLLQGARPDSLVRLPWPGLLTRRTGQAHVGYPLLDALTPASTREELTAAGLAEAEEGASPADSPLSPAPGVSYRSADPATAPGRRWYRLALLKPGAPVHTTPMHAAVASGRLDMLMLLCDALGEGSVPTSGGGVGLGAGVGGEGIDAQDGQGLSPLYLAAAMAAAGLALPCMLPCMPLVQRETVRMLPSSLACVRYLLQSAAQPVPFLSQSQSHAGAGSTARSSSGFSLAALLRGLQSSGESAGCWSRSAGEDEAETGPTGAEALPQEHAKGATEHNERRRHEEELAALCLTYVAYA